MEPFLDELDATATLAAAAEAVHTRRTGLVEELEIAAHWADLHATDPQDRPGAVPAWAGGDHLIDYGGEGAPKAQDLCREELAVALGVHPAAAGMLIADALDLRHRLPRTWVVTRELRCEPWLARKIARATHHLTHAQAAQVDHAIAPLLPTDTPGRVLRATDAAVITADPVTHAAKVEKALRERYVRLGQPDDHGLCHLIARIETGAAHWVDDLLSRVVDILRSRPDLTSGLPADAGADELRAEAFGWLARPADLADLLASPADLADLLASPADLADLLASPHPADEPDEDRPEETSAEEPESGNLPVRVGDRHRDRRQAVLYLHLHGYLHDTGHDTGHGAGHGAGPDAGHGAGLAVEPVVLAEGLGALVPEQLPRLLRGVELTCTPVVDLAATRTVDGYHHPDDVAQRTLLRTGGEVFPHATRTSRRLDLDHPDPYRRPDAGGPPGQTGDHNAAPLTRHTHRAKTHLGYQLTELAPGSYLWRTPHGLWRHVGPDGTTELDEAAAHHLLDQHQHEQEFDRAYDHIGRAFPADETD